MSKQNPTPLLNGIDDPHGINTATPENVKDTRMGEYFIERVQDIRWELFALLTDLDDVDAVTDAAMMLVPQAIDLLGIAIRAEAAYYDDLNDAPGHAPHLFYPDVRRIQDEG